MNELVSYCKGTQLSHKLSSKKCSVVLTNVTFHRKTRLIEHFNLGQTVFQTPSNGVCKAFAKGLQSVCKGFGKSLKRF